MAETLPPFKPGNAPPQLLSGEPSLALAAATSLQFVDYALADLPTPSVAFHTLAHSLPDELIATSHPVRAALAHGTVLRDVLAAQLPPDHEAHRDWTALRGWIVNLSDDRILGLIEYGIHENLAVDGSRTPAPPARETAGLRGTVKHLRENGGEVLRSWDVADSDARADELTDPTLFRSTLLELLDAIWADWLRDAWTERLPELDAAAAVTPLPPPGCGGVQWIQLVSGLLPDPAYTMAANFARRLTVLPMPGLEDSLATFGLDDADLFVLYTPDPIRHATASTERLAASLAHAPVDRLARLTPVVQTLGEPSRLAIMLHLLEHGPSTMHQLTDALRVHQTTISRQVATLRKAGLTNQDNQRRIVPNRDELRAVFQSLLDLTH